MTSGQLRRPITIGGGAPRWAEGFRTGALEAELEHRVRAVAHQPDRP